MTVYGYVFWFFTTILILSFIAGYIRADYYNEKQEPIDHNTLTYCEGCGCRHKLMYMNWRRDKYRCIICCHDYDPGPRLS